MVKRGTELRGGYRGQEFEADILGVPKFPERYKAKIRQLEARAEGGYLPYAVIQRAIRENYPEDPTNPSKEFARDLRLEVCEQLGLADDDADAVKFYSAIGTPLDKRHSVDAWLEVDLDDDGRTLHAEVSLDATLNDIKLEGGYKADVIVGDVPVPSDKRYLAVVNGYATEVVDFLFTRLSAEKAKQGVRRTA